MNTNQADTVLGAFQGISRQADLIRRSCERLKQRTRQISMSQEERNSLLSEIGSIEGWLKTIRGEIASGRLALLPISYEKMWTTEQDDWWLLEGENPDQIMDYSPFYVPTRVLIIIEIDEWYRYVIQQMKESGNRIVTPKDLIPLMPPIQILDETSGSEAESLSNHTPSSESDETES